MALLATIAPASAAVPPNVILISVDTLRSDRLPVYGYGAIKTPHLDRFRADGVLFERAWTHVPLTAPAHASMLTGRLPANHGIRDNSGFVLDPHIPTIASDLARRGYVTGAMVSTKVLAPKTGLAKGFAVYDQKFDTAERDGAQTIAAALQWIGRQKTKPFFLLLHLYEPHTPYRKMAGVANAYDAEIVRVDTLLAKFFNELRRQRLYDSSLIVFTSDHGEGLNEHGEKQHGILLYRESLQVPLIVKYPGNARRGTRVAADAQLIDIAPTILQHAGIDIRGRGLPGMSLLALTPSRPVYAESFYPRFQLGWHELHSLIQGNLHLIAGRRTELYDLARDPKERTSLVDAQRRAAVALQRQLRAQVVSASAPARAPNATPIDETLLGLGYLSGGSEDDTTFRPHPPDRITIFNPMLKLMTALKRKQYQDALKRADEILKAHPEYPEMWEHKARALIGLGRKPEAERALEEAIRLAKP